MNTAVVDDRDDAGSGEQDRNEILLNRSY